MTFSCIKCGLCCRKVGSISYLSYLAEKNGCCKYFDESSNLCTIYDNRPELCRVDESYKYFSDKLSLDEYYYLNMEGCRSLWREAKMINK
ncbi:YkgJ family cysteine cluster protein [Candidatus Enterococcus moelleringii]|uniref:YkgJ family cysteine cluster protein n=1 Tax=Candidatus Enterococcus moelleringii TaxID=2815325 RepID=UPI003D3558A6